MFKEAIDVAQGRFQEEINRATKGKKVDLARVKRRKNEQYHERLVRSVLGISQNLELNDSLYSLAMAMPEGLVSKMYYMAWGDARKQKDADGAAPELMKLYGGFSSEYNIAGSVNVVDQIKKGSINKSLICHGLSPTSDTVLLLAELGRSLRLSKALSLDAVEILLADISWVKYNRSISQALGKKEFLDKLRVCIDKRKRLYSALNLSYKTFGITDFGSNDTHIKKSDILEAAKKYRELASALWGNQCLDRQNPAIKALIGRSFNGLNKNHLSNLPSYMQTFLDFESFGAAIEKNLTDELVILRTLSELFSTFDDEIFIYYFAQYFAQRTYNNYLKMAPSSEMKFDVPFEKMSSHFNMFMKTNKKANNKKIYNGHIYYPQYRLGKYEILPYTSISGDVAKQKLSISNFLSSTILIDDSYHEEIDKILGVLTETPSHHRNRLLSDLLSFLHFLFSNARLNESKYKKIKECVFKIDAIICEQIFSKEGVDNYPEIFSDALKAIAGTEVVLPFHLIPYTWDDSVWTVDMHKSCAMFIKEILSVVNEICE